MTVINIHKVTFMLIAGVMSISLCTPHQINLFDDIEPEEGALWVAVVESNTKLLLHIFLMYQIWLLLHLKTSVHVHALYVTLYTQTDLNASEGCKRLLARSQGDDVSFHQQTDRQVHQLGVAVRPVKGPRWGRGCVQIRVQRWRPPNVTHTPRQIVWRNGQRKWGGSRERKRGGWWVNVM